MRRSLWCAVGLLVGLCGLGCSVSAQGIDPASLPRVEAGDLSYLGSFSLPQRDSTQSLDGRLTYGGNALALAPDGGLYLVGHAQTHPARVFEVSIPDLGGVATMRQDGTDPSGGRSDQVDPGNDIRIGGLLVYGGRLISSYYSYYDADESAVLSHAASGLRLDSDAVVGPVRVGSAGAGFVGGPMVLVPAEWREALGGPALTGQCCLAIIGRSSLGPSLSVFDPDDIGRVSPVPATMLVGYPYDHPTLGEWRSPSTRYNGTTEIGGVAFPAGTRSVLFVGRQGLGEFCYGTGDACHDPVSSAQGVHAYPYINQVWAYDANDLARVKAGELEPWQVEPYATWRLTDLNDSGSASIRGAVYDAATQRLYVTESYGERPTVHVYALTVGRAEQPEEPPVVEPPDEPEPPAEEPPSVEEPDEPAPPVDEPANDPTDDPTDEPTIRALLETILQRLTPAMGEARCEIAHEPSTYADGDVQVTLRCPAGVLAPVKGAPLTVRPPDED